MWRSSPQATADVAIDLGTTRTRMVARGKGVLLDLPTVVAPSPQGGATVVGEEAHALLGRAGGGVRVIQPVRGGSIEDYAAVEELLRHVLVASGRTKPTVLLAVPTTATEVERRALQEAARAAGAADVRAVPTALAAAIGAQLPAADPTGSMIVVVGGGRTEVAVVSLGGLVVRRALEVAGDTMDTQIAQWLRRHHDLVVGQPTAERIKIDVGAARPPARRTQTRIRGRDLASGAPQVFDVSGAHVAEAIREAVERIRDVVLEALRETPPELAADILESGVILAGGGARLRDLDGVLRDATQLPFLLADPPDQATALGLARLLDDPDLYARVVDP